MSDTKHSDSGFKNENTVQRRAWIDRALTGVKEHVSAREAPPCVIEERPRPRLYIVDSNTKR